MGKLTDEEILQRRIEPLDYSPSSGSIGVPYHQDGPTEHDGRSKTHTTFYPSEATNQPNRDWESMAQVQDGKYEGGEEGTRKRHANQRRDLKTFFNTVDLSNWEEKYALCLLNYLHKEIENEENDEDEDVFYHNGDSLLLAIITFAANKNDRRIRGNDGYEELLEALNVTRKDVRTSRKDIRDKRNN